MTKGPCGGLPLQNLCSSNPSSTLKHLHCSPLLCGFTRPILYLSRLPFQIEAGEHLLDRCYNQIETEPHCKQEARARFSLSIKWLGRVQCPGNHLKGKIINVNLTELSVGGRGVVCSEGSDLNMGWFYLTETMWNLLPVLNGDMIIHN